MQKPTRPHDGTYVHIHTSGTERYAHMHSYNVTHVVQTHTIVPVHAQQHQKKKRKQQYAVIKLTEKNKTSCFVLIDAFAVFYLHSQFYSLVFSAL